MSVLNFVDDEKIYFLWVVVTQKYVYLPIYDMKMNFIII